jgi:Bacteriophage Mu, Gp27
MFPVSSDPHQGHDVARPGKKKKVPSTITRLPKSVQEEIKRLRNDEGATIDEILTHLRKLDVQVSRSALGRHTQSLDDMVSHLEFARVSAEAIAKNFGDAQDDKLARVNVEFLQSSILRLNMAAHEAMMLAEQKADDDEPVPFPISAKELLELSRAVQALAGTEKSIQERIRTAVRDAEEKTRKEAATNATKAARSQGLSKDTVDAIRFAVLGSDT